MRSKIFCWSRITATLLACVGTPAFAELKPLLETVNGDTEASYQYLRCASLYTANLEWAGTQLPEDVFDDTKSVISSLITIAVLIRNSTNDSNVEIISQAVLEDTRAVANLYLEQYRSSYAGSGNAWLGNSLWEKDSEYCKSVGEAALEYTNSMEETQ